MIFFDRTAAHTGKHHTNDPHSVAKGQARGRAGGPTATRDETALPYYSVHSHTTC